MFYFDVLDHFQDWLIIAIEAVGVYNFWQQFEVTIRFYGHSVASKMASDLLVLVYLAN